MKVIRWGIIGCGDVCEVKSGPGFQKAEHSALVAVMRRDGKLAADFAKRHHVPRWYDDAEKLIHDSEVDAIYIATPPKFHKHYTLMAAQAGKPIYVEKPMAMNFAECQEMIAACHANNTPLFIAYYRRAMARFLKIKELIDSTVIGDLRFVTATLCLAATNDMGPEKAWRVIPEISGGGRFIDMGCHMLDFLDYLLGPIESAQGFATNQAHYYQAEDIVSANFIFASGVHGTGVWCFTGFKDFDSIEMVGSKGKITFSVFQAGPIQLITASGTQEFNIPFEQHVQQPLIQTIVNELNGIGHCPSTAESGARTSRVMDEIINC